MTGSVKTLRVRVFYIHSFTKLADSYINFLANCFIVKCSRIIGQQICKTLQNCKGQLKRYACNSKFLKMGLNLHATWRVFAEPVT